MNKNVHDLYKSIQATIDRIKEKPSSSEKLVELEGFIRKIRKEL